nr:hypothetical protein [Mucilaginibacter sp. FT3.2]
MAKLRAGNTQKHSKIGKYVVYIILCNNMEAKSLF